VASTNASKGNALLKQLLLNDSRLSVQQLAQNDRFTINQTQTVNDETVTLGKLEADANTIILGIL